MFRTLRLLVPLSLSLAAAATIAQAADEAASAPIANPRADETAAQIDDWIREASAEPAAEAPAQGTQAIDRRIHGEVGFGIGSNGYRSAYGVATMPIGKTGTATVALSEGRMNFRGGRRATNRSLALSLAFGDAARPAATGGPGPCEPGMVPGPFNRRWGPSPGELPLACRAAAAD